MLVERSMISQTKFRRARAAIIRKISSASMKSIHTDPIAILLYGFDLPGESASLMLRFRDARHDSLPWCRPMAARCSLFAQTRQVAECYWFFSSRKAFRFFLHEIVSGWFGPRVFSLIAKARRKRVSSSLYFL